MGMVRDALDRGLNIQEVRVYVTSSLPQCYVDALGPSQIWQDKLSAAFPSIKFTVCPKADSIYKIVGAASIIAKVTRDRYIEHWSDPESQGLNIQQGQDQVVRGSGYPSGEFVGRVARLSVESSCHSNTCRPQDSSISPRRCGSSVWIQGHYAFLLGDSAGFAGQAGHDVPVGGRFQPAVCKELLWRRSRQGPTQAVARCGDIRCGGAVSSPICLCDCLGLRRCHCQPAQGHGGADLGCLDSRTRCAFRVGSSMPRGFWVYVGRRLPPRCLGALELSYKPG